MSDIWYEFYHKCSTVRCYRSLKAFAATEFKFWLHQTVSSTLKMGKDSALKRWKIFPPWGGCLPLKIVLNSMTVLQNTLFALFHVLSWNIKFT